jgi:hypothetical protein
MIRNLTEHVAHNAAELSALLGVAKAQRSTAVTERNTESSRSHGVVILKFSHPEFASSIDLTSSSDSATAQKPTDEVLSGMSAQKLVRTSSPAAGILYMVDLAGSERMADSKNHDAERMKETKAINLSLMSLKDCIRARTMASKPGA